MKKKPLYVSIDWNVKDIVFGPEKLQEILELMQDDYVITGYEDDAYGNVCIIFRHAIPECLKYEGTTIPNFDEVQYREIQWDTNIRYDVLSNASVEISTKAYQHGWRTHYSIRGNSCRFHFTLRGLKKNKFGLNADFRETTPFFRISVKDNKDPQLALLHYLTRNGYSITNVKTISSAESETKTAFIVERNENDQNH